MNTLTKKMKDFVILNSNQPSSLIAKDLKVDKKLVEDFKKECRRRTVSDLSCPITGHRLNYKKKIS